SDAPKPAAPAATAAPQAPAAAPTVAAKPAADAKPAAETKPAADAKPDGQAIKRGGQLVESINWTYPTMDPHLTSIAYLVGTGPGALYNNLVRLELVDPKTLEHKVVGDLAESWEQTDPPTLIIK